MTQVRASENRRIANHALMAHRFDWSAQGQRFLLVLLLLLFAIKAFVPAWSSLNTDFANYYLAARLYRQGYPLERVYDWVWFQRQWDHTGNEHRLVSYQPLTHFSALMVAPWALDPALKAKRIWLLLNLIFLLLIAILLARCTDLGWRRVLLLIFLAFFPLRSNFAYGQMHVLVLLLLTVAAFLYLKNRPFASGIALALAAALKIYPLLFGGLFLLRRQWRAAWGLLLGVAATALLSIQLFGIEACRVYVREVLPWALRSQTIDPYDVGWGSLSAMFLRLFVAEPELNPSPVAHLPWLYALLYPLTVSLILVAFLWAICCKAPDPERRNLEWASYLFLLMLLSSQPASYHLVALILPAVLITGYLLQRGRTTTAATLVVLYVLACGSYTRFCPSSPSGWKTVLCFPRLLFMLIYAGVLFSLLTDSLGKGQRNKIRSWSSAFALVAFLVLFGSGFTLQMRRFRGQFDNYCMRVLNEAGSALTAEPVVKADSMLFTALVPRFLPSIPDTYSVREFTHSSITSFAVGGDWFHPAVGKAADIAWAEMITKGKSRIVRFNPRLPVNGAADFEVEVEDAEQPVASADGEWLLFIREVQGRNSLWLRHLGNPGAGDRQIAEANYDVREAAFFPDDRIAFSSRHNGRFRLFAVDTDSGGIKEMPAPGCSARYPAASGDGEWLAFSCEQTGTWQLHAMNLRTRSQTQLTDADCNSVSPAWTSDSKSLIYASDCGRGLGLTALAKLSVVR